VFVGNELSWPCIEAVPLEYSLLVHRLPDGRATSVAFRRGAEMIEHLAGENRGVSFIDASGGILKIRKREMRKLFPK
jgi:hypothetical protein